MPYIYICIYYTKLKYFTTRTREVIKNKTNKLKQVYKSSYITYIHGQLHLHHTTSPKNYSGSNKPDNFHAIVVCIFCCASQLHFAHPRQDWTQHYSTTQLLCQPKTARNCSAASHQRGETDTLVPQTIQKCVS